MEANADHPAHALIDICVSAWGESISIGQSKDEVIEMDITRPGQNGMREVAVAPGAKPNLTLEQKLVKGHTGIDAVPGYVLAVFEKRGKGGAIFSRLVRPGERSPAIFRIPFLDWAQKYFAVAVNDSVLSYQFDHEVTLDEGNDVFILNFHLKYRVADHQRVAAVWEQDPLKQLCDEVARLIGKNCARRKPEMFRHRFRELEKIVIAGESHKLKAYATTLGLKIMEIDLNLPLADYKWQQIDARNRAAVEKDRYQTEQGLNRFKQTDSRAWKQGLDKDDLNHKYDLQSLGLDREISISDRLDDVARQSNARRLREVQTDAIAQALVNVGASIQTPSDLRDGFEVAREIGQGIQADSNNPSLGTALPGKEPSLIGSGEDRLSSLLSQGIREVDRWTCTFAQKQALRSTLLHIIAEALLDDHADEKTLTQYANKLSEIGKGMQPPLNGSQRLFLAKFRNVDELRDMLR
jgi:hypothetical protein